MSTTSDYKKGKSNQVKIYMFRGSNYKKGGLNLADDRSFLSGGRWPRFLPNFSDNHLPHLDLGPGGRNIRGSFPLGGQLRRGAFLPKRTTGATGENWKVEPSLFLGSGPSSYCRKNKWNQERK
jgi:hypothetical protein